MKKIKLTDFLNDKFNFLENYFKFNLPNITYYKKIKQTINNSSNISEYRIPKNLKQDIKSYWSKYNKKINLNWHKAYIATNSIEDVRYIPEHIFYKEILPTFNRMELSIAYSDKNVYDKIFKDFKIPTTVIRNMGGVYSDINYNILKFDQIISKIYSAGMNNKLVIKPAIDSGGGIDVEIIDISNKSRKEVTTIMKKKFSKYKQDFIIQEYLEQSTLMSEIHPSSLNTIRIMTLRFKGTIHILSSIVRMGNNGSTVDNATVGGLTCGITQKGKLNEFATEHYEYNKYYTHPYSNFKFKDARIPNLNSIYKLVTKAHQELPYFDIVSWDIAVSSNDEPYIIEINLRFQDINFHQRNNGPLFAELTDEVLNEVFLETN